MYNSTRMVGKPTLQRLIYLIIFLVFVSTDVTAEKMLLHVSVKKQQYTDYSTPCKTEKNSEFDCIPFYFWYIYNAKVLNIIEGDYKNKKIKFAVLQHGEYQKYYVKDVYVIVEEFENTETINKLKTKYFSNGVIHSNEVVCLPKEFIEPIKEKSKFKYVNLISKTGDQLCFLKELLDSGKSE